MLCDKLIKTAWAGGGIDNIGVAVARRVPDVARLGEPLFQQTAADSPNFDF